ncbi:MAG: phosphodiester glycosidase family protein [Clostridia bacterium]|nr:phosphodiester glycosidase family protein [Clostridia bacterium]
MMKTRFLHAAALLCAVMLLPLPGLTEAAEATGFEPLPIDFTFGHVAAEEHYTESGYEDASLTVRVEKIVTETGTWNVARVKIADPSQLRTVVTKKGKTNKISTMAKKVNAVIAIGGEYFASDEGGYIVRMGKIQQSRKTPYETRDLLAIDGNGDFHILRRTRDAKVNGKSKSINPDFADQLKELYEAQILVNVFDFGPALVIDGEVQEMPASYSFNLGRREPRCAIGQAGPLEYVLVVVDAARDGKSGATGEELAAFMAEQGCVQAYNLDGGNSALMFFHGENYSDKSVSAERSVSDIIYFATLVDSGLDGE